MLDLYIPPSLNPLMARDQGCGAPVCEVEIPESAEEWNATLNVPVKYTLKCDIAKRPSQNLWLSHTQVLGLFRNQAAAISHRRILFNGELFILF